MIKTIKKYFLKGLTTFEFNRMLCAPYPRMIKALMKKEVATHRKIS